MGKHGPQKGVRYKPTIQKEQAREALRQLVLNEMESLVAAQLANAKGLKYLVARNTKTGKFERVTPSMLDVASDELLERIEVWEKDPSVPAFSDLLNRAIDKPAEQPQELKLTGEVTLITRLHAARKRLADAKKRP